MSPDAQLNTATPDTAIPDAVTPAAQRSPMRKRFTPRSARVAMPVDAAARQGRVAMLAWEALGDGEAVRAFLNTHDVELGARPIDLATQSEAGLSTVTATIAALGGSAR